MLNIIKSKGCKRCGGDLFLERDMDGVYVTCLQCGATFSDQLKSENEHQPVPVRVIAR
jgi:hypothetical protein